jgi:2-amino-4-hydroxy-6-hydroxymethyldihydropteridine diphosphokinase
MSVPDGSVPVVACIGLGANLGAAVDTVRAAQQALEGLPETRLLSLSRLYRTPAWGKTAQPDFINAAALLETSLSPRALLDGLLAIERRFGRTRAADGSDRWGARTLDLDLLLYGDERINELGLHVPHPHLHERAFALVPLLEVAPDAVIPGLGPASAFLATMATGDIEALG